MLVICDASNNVEYDRITPQLSNAALHITQDANSQQYRDVYP